MNKAFLPLTEEDKNFIDASPSLFGSAFAQKSKELVDQVKAMRSHLIGRKDGKQEFFEAFLLTAGGITSTTSGQREEEATVGEDWDAPHKGRKAHGTNKPSTHSLNLFFFDYETLVHCRIICMSGHM